MRYGLISDIHSNLEAFKAVLDSLSKERIDRFLCIGDLVGYGADPKECIRLVKSLKPSALVAGNHDWGAAALTDIGYFNADAKEAVLWTRDILDQGELDYLKSFRLIYEEGLFTLVHGTLNSPEKFYYILDVEDAYPTMKLMRTILCFVGHSHVPGIFYCDDSTIHFTNQPKIKIDRSAKYIINIGSIGQPRDLDPRASCAIYDDEEETVEILRVKYDIKAASDKILASGLPKSLAFRLLEGR